MIYSSNLWCQVKVYKGYQGLVVAEAYVDTTCIQGPYRPAQTGDLVFKMRRTPPAFSPSLWNVHGPTLNNNPRTNNLCEGWNSKFFNLVGHHHPSIWRLISALQEENSSVSLAMAQDAVGNPTMKRNQKVYDNLQKKLERLVKDFIENKKVIPAFLQGVGENLQSNC